MVLQSSLLHRKANIGMDCYELKATVYSICICSVDQSGLGMGVDPGSFEELKEAHVKYNLASVRCLLDCNFKISVKEKTEHMQNK